MIGRRLELNQNEYLTNLARRESNRVRVLLQRVGLMEREGTGIDLLYERLLATGRAAPTIVEGPDSVHVTVPRRVLHPAVIRLLEDADSRYQLTQRERIALGMLAQSDGLRAVEFAARLALEDVGSLRTWVARLLEVGLVEQTGRTLATRYFVPPAILQSAGLERRRCHVPSRSWSATGPFFRRKTGAGAPTR